MEAEAEVLKKSSFRRLLELGDKEHRAVLENYYIVSEGRMDNFIQCLEDGYAKIKEQTTELTSLREENEQKDIAIGQLGFDLDQATEENKRLREAAKDLLSVLLPSDVVYIGSKHNKYSACYASDIDDPIKRLQKALNAEQGGE